MLFRLDDQYNKCLLGLNLKMDLKKEYTCVELLNGGNIRFDYGKESDSWYKPCYDLVMARYCHNEHALSSAITGIRILNILRVTNRSLFAKFEENILTQVDENDYINNRIAFRKKIEYLLYCWRSRLASPVEELFSIIHSGFKPATEYKVHTQGR